MIYQFPTRENMAANKAEDDVINVQLDLSFDLPGQIASQLEALGITEFETCSYDPARRIMSASVKAALYRRGA